MADLPQKSPPSLCLLGALAGDVIGSTYEFHPNRSMQFELFPSGSQATDDSLLTVAVADAILSGRSYRDCILQYARAYPRADYGARFEQWIHMDNPLPYNSFGNGSAMRVSAVGWAFNTVADVLREAAASAAVTHDHPEGIKGAQAVALAILLARQGASRDAIRQEITSRFGYALSSTLAEIRPSFRFNETCQETVPPAMLAFLESHNFEDAIRLSVSLGGDADTLAAITGSIAEAFYGRVPEHIVVEVQPRVPPALWQVVERFNRMVALKA